MIGTLYRNAGRAGFFNVRWLGGKTGHTVAAAQVQREGKTELVIADALERSRSEREIWSSTYFARHRWPTGYTGVTPDIYAMSMSVRGLDSYVWAEGCIIRGPRAGLLTHAGIPYLPGREKPSVQRVAGLPKGGSVSAAASRGSQQGAFRDKGSTGGG